MNKFKTLVLIVTIIILSVSCVKKNQKEIEPNDYISNATKFDISSPICGTLDNENDKDYFSFFVSSSLTCSISLSPVKGINHAFVLLKKINDNYEIQKTVDEARKSSEEKVYGLYLEEGEYAILISHGNRDSKKGDPKSKYYLSVSEMTSPCKEIEPNDNFEQATAITSFDEDIVAYCSPAFTIFIY